MKIDEEYECDHLNGKTLRVVRIHNKHLAVVKVNDTEQTLLFSQYPPDPPHLCLAHIGKEQTRMRKKQKELPHASN